MINIYRVRTPNSVAGVAAQDIGNGTYDDGTTHRVRVYAYADVPNVGRVYSAGYAESAAVIPAQDESKITWTVTPGVPYGNEPHYVPTTGYMYLKENVDPCGMTFNYFQNSTATLVDLACADWAAGNPALIGPLSPAVFVVTPQADIPRANPLYTVAGAATLVALFNKAIANASSSGNSITHGSGSPEGVVTANIGDLYIDVAAAFPVLWIKQTGDGTNTGWHS